MSEVIIMAAGLWGTKGMGHMLARLIFKGITDWSVHDRDVVSWMGPGSYVILYSLRFFLNDVRTSNFSLFVV